MSHHQDPAFIIFAFQVELANKYLLQSYSYFFSVLHCSMDGMELVQLWVSRSTRNPKSGHSSFRRPCFQRGEVRENAKSPTDRGFVPKNLRNKRRFEPATLTYPMSKQLRLDTSLAGLKNSKQNMCFARTKHHAKKRRRRTKFCSQWRPIRGRIRTKITTINHINIFMHILGVCLCISGWIGRLWLSRHHFSSAALFRVLELRLIVMNCISSYNNSPIKLKLSHE